MYKRLYPTGSALARFYGTAKIHKSKNDRAVDELPIRPVISNINTASFQLAKYLAKLLSLPSMSEYNVKSTSDFITHIKGQNIPNNLKLISFDVTSLFTNVPLDFTMCILVTIEISIHKQTAWQWVRRWVQYLPVYLWLN